MAQNRGIPTTACDTSSPYSQAATEVLLSSVVASCCAPELTRVFTTEFLTASTIKYLLQKLMFTFSLRVPYIGTVL